MLARSTEKSDTTLPELLAALQDRGVRDSYFGVWSIIHRSGHSVKKRPPRCLDRDRLRLIQPQT